MRLVAARVQNRSGFGFRAGLLGGLVYVNTFTLIAKEVDGSIQAGPAIISSGHQFSQLGACLYCACQCSWYHLLSTCMQEFALAATSVGESVGTLIADVSGVLIQGCMFRKNGLPGADFKCGA